MRLAADRRRIVISVIFAVLFGIGLMTGYTADRFGELRFGDIAAWGVLAAGLIIGFAIAFVIAGLTDIYSRPDDKMKPGFLISWIIIAACWIPVFLAEYPGFFVYDASEEYVSVATRVFSTHHPLLHTLVLGGSVRAGEVFAGSANAGIAVYMAAQMIVLSALFAWVVSSMRRFAIFALAWYGVFPVVVMFVLCSVKDTMFSAALFAAAVLTFRVMREDATLRDRIFLCLSLLLMMLMRHNGVYAFLIYALVLTAYSAVTVHGNLLKKSSMGIALAGTLFAYGALSALLAFATGADSSENQEILTVPIQQVARNWNAYSDEMSDDQLTALYEVIPESALKRYTPNLSDPVKIDFDNAAYSADPARYRKLWYEMFKAHPAGFVNAWLDTCYGYFYPFTVVNVYEGHTVFTFTYTESSYFGYETEYPGERHSYIPFIDRFYRWLSLDDDIQRIPVISLLFSMGAMFWFYVLCLMVFIYRKSPDAVIALILPLAVQLTLIAGPTFLPRYTVFWWFMLPFFVHELFVRRKA